MSLITLNLRAFEASHSFWQISLVSILVLTIAICSPVKGGELTDIQIVEGLSKVRTRSLTPPPKPTKDELEKLDVLKSRGLKFVSQVSEEVNLAYDIVNKYKYPKLSFSIEFAFGSTDIDKKSEQQLIYLSKALKSDKFTGAQFVLAGHTDAKGSDDFNLELSYQRANAVLNYLVSEAKVSQDLLSSVGLGESKLKNTDDPFADVNRRVEIINLTAQ